MACFVSLSASNSNKIEVTAKSVETTKDTVYAKEGVIVHYDNAIIKSKRAAYNKTTKKLILDGNVEFIGYEGSKEYTTHMELQTDTKEVSFKKLFLVSKNDVWLLSENADKKEGTYILGSSILSSCEVENPLWHLAFSNSIYDSNKKYMKLYHAKVYFGSIPIFYTPYLAFSTSKERSSGLLFPKLGYTETEGYTYEQPIFWAISPSMDLELNPQIRTSRSMGMYTTLRFVDSNHSSGKFRVGYFKDKKSYVATNKPKNDAHYGLEFYYDTSKLFESYLPNEYKDGLYINTRYLNDIDYINLQKSRLGNFGLNPLQESRVNYFAHNNTHYFGLNAKYFIDTRLDNNDKTIQFLPSLQWHKYLNHIVWNNLTYSIDTQVRNITRKEGSTLKQAEIRVPIEYTTSFFNNYLNLSLSEELYYSKYLFGNDVYEQDTFQYYNNTHKVKMFTDLTKQYKNFMHVLLPSLSYVKPGTQNQSPVNFDDLNETQKELFAVAPQEEQINFSLGQYFYNMNGKLKFFQRFTQNYYLNREKKLDDARNEMGVFLKKWLLYNEIVYSNEFDAIRSISSSVTLKEDTYNFSIGHIYQQTLTEDKTEVASNNINLNFGYMFNDRVSIGGGLAYDFEKSVKTQWQIGGGYHQDCWSIDLSLRQAIRPSATGPQNLTSYYLQLNFIPFGTIGAGKVK